MVSERRVAETKQDCRPRAEHNAHREKHVGSVVLAFGHLPRDVGGKQTTGLCFAIHDIARSLSSGSLGKRYLLCCTDITSPVRDVLVIKTGVHVVGCTTRDLIIHLFARPGLSLLLLLAAVKHFIRYGRHTSIARILGKLLLFSSAIEQYSPAILHLHDAANIVLANYIPSARSLPRVGTIHAEIGRDPSFPSMSNRLERDAMTKADVFVYVSSRLRAAVTSNHGMGRARHIVIRNGVDPVKFHPLDRDECRRQLGFHLDKRVFLTVGAVSQRKGQSRIIEAYRYLRDPVRQTISLVLVGHGTARLVERLNDEGLDVTACEHIDQAALCTYYNAADYVLSASSSEGFGLPLAESLACGTPVVLPSTCDIVEEGFIVDGVNAIVYDAPSRGSICQAIQAACALHFDSCDVLESQMGTTWDDVAMRYEKLFASLGVDPVSCTP